MKIGQYYLIKYYDKITAVKLTEKYTCDEWKGWKIKPQIPEQTDGFYYNEGEGGILVAINEESTYVIRKLTKSEFEQIQVEKEI